MNRPTSIRTHPTAALAPALLMLAAAPETHAGNLFQVFGQTTDAFPAATVEVGGSSLPDLVDHLINGVGSFNALNNRPFFALLNYASVADALRFNVQDLGASGWRATLTTPFQSGLINHQFQAPTREQLEGQIEDYLKKDGLSDLARFLNAINDKSAYGTTDGNPNSSTALAAAYSFSEYGMALSPTNEEKEDAKEAEGRVGFGFTTDVGFIRAQGLKAETYSFNPYVPIKLSKRVRLDIGVPLNFTQIEGAQVFRAGLQLALPVLVSRRTYEQGKPVNPWLWQLTPHGGVHVAGSFDMVSGGLLTSGGLTSLVGYDFGKFEVTMGNQISFYESLEVTLGDYRLDPQVSSQILKNGLKIGVPFARRWYAEAYAIDTELLNNQTFTSRYTTLGGGVGYRFLGKPDAEKKRKGYAMIGAYTHLASSWTSANVQLGTGWKF